MSKQELFLAKVKSKNLSDDRNAVVVANAKKLPNGEYGLCLLSINGNILRISDTNFKQEIGSVLYEIPLNQISNVKASSFVFNRYLKFIYKNQQFCGSFQS